MLKRRDALLLLGTAGAVTGMVGAGPAGAASSDGTPMQFMPKTAKDPDPLVDELAKYAKCPYCGMGRRKWHHSRMLIHYADDLVDGTCSLHCAAISLSVNLDRGPKAIYSPDFASDAEIKPLIEVDKAAFLIGSALPGTMTKRSKRSFASAGAAKAAQAKHGGELGTFDDALRAAYLDMAADTIMIRKRRAEKRHKMQKKQ